MYECMLNKHEPGRKAVLNILNLGTGGLHVMVLNIKLNYECNKVPLEDLSSSSSDYVVGQLNQFHFGP